MVGSFSLLSMDSKESSRETLCRNVDKQITVQEDSNGDFYINNKIVLRSANSSGKMPTEVIKALEDCNSSIVYNTREDLNVSQAGFPLISEIFYNTRFHYCYILIPRAISINLVGGFTLTFIVHDEQVVDCPPN